MFVISQFVLHKSNMCKFDNISTYAIASGLIVYASIYLYLLFYNNDYVSLFNKFIIYIIGIDLLLSTFYYFNTSKKQNPVQLNFEQIPNVELLNISNDVNINSDDETCSNDEESDFEVETEDNYHEETEIDTTQVQTPEQLQTPEQTQTPEQLQTIDTETVDTEKLQTVDTEILQQTLEKINSEDQPKPLEKGIDVSESIDNQIDSEQIVKKRRGRKPNSLKTSNINVTKY